MDLADPDQWNPYTYATGNPLTNADPTGLLSGPTIDDGGGRRYATSQLREFNKRRQRAKEASPLNWDVDSVLINPQGIRNPRSPNYIPTWFCEPPHVEAGADRQRTRDLLAEIEARHLSVSERQVLHDPTTWNAETWGYIALGLGAVALALTGVGPIAELGAATAFWVGLSAVSLDAGATYIGRDACGGGSSAGCGSEVLGTVSLVVGTVGLGATARLAFGPATLTSAGIAALQTVAGAADAAGFATSAAGGVASAADVFGWGLAGTEAPYCTELDG